jgi:hypothetical protein
MLFQSVIHNKSVILSTTQTAGSELIVQDVGAEYRYGRHFLLQADVMLSDRLLEQTTVFLPPKLPNFKKNVARGGHVLLSARLWPTMSDQTVQFI